MLKIDYKNEIKESPEKLKELYKEEKNVKLKERVEVLLWLKTGKVDSMAEAMRLKSRSLNHGQNIWNLYKESGLEGCLKLKYRPQSSPLAEKPELIEKLQEQGFSTIKEASLWILTTYGIEYTENGLGNYFRKHKIKLKTGRPSHPLQDEEKRELFKKNMKKN